MVFRKPADDSLQPAWKIVEDEFRRAKTRRINLNDIYAALLSPPIGMKTAAIPVFVTAALLASSDRGRQSTNTALSNHCSHPTYRSGWFATLVTSISSILPTPPGLADKSSAHSPSDLGVRPGFRKHRVANVLSVVGHLVSMVRHLDNYTLRTRNLSPATLEARNILVTSVEPDEMLFSNLPKALGFRTIPADARIYRKARDYAENVGTVIDELTGCHDRLLEELFHLLLETSAENTRKALMGQAAAP